MANRTNRTHVEDVENPGKILLPTCDLLFVVLREDESKHHIPFALLDHLPLNHHQGSTIQISVSRWLAVGQSGLPSQISNRIQDGFGEPIRPFSFQSPVEYLTHVTASPAKVDEILIVGHRVLDASELEVPTHNSRKRARIIARRTLADPKATWAGGMPQVSFAMLKT